MTDKNKTKDQLIDELAKARWQIKELEKMVFRHEKIEETIKENTAKYRLLSESSQDGIYVSATEGFEYVNPAFEKIFEYKAKEVYSKDFNFLDTIHPDDKKLIAERKEARKKGKKITSLYSFRIITKSGKTKQVEVNTAPLPGEGTRIMGILRDITEQKQTEDALKESEQKYRAIFETTSNATLIIEDDMTISLANAESEKLSGFSKKEIEGKKKWTDFVVKEDLARMKKYHDSRRKDRADALRKYEFRLINRAGKVRHIFLAVDMIPGTKKSVASLMDITERKEAEDKIKLLLEFEKIVTLLSSRFVGILGVNKSINGVLHDIGKFTQADRAYLFLLRNSGSVMDNTHEWCKTGVTPQIENMQNLPSNIFPWWMNKLQKDKIINIQDVAKMPEAAKAEKEVLESQGIKSIIVLPVDIRGKLSGFIGLDDVAETKKWSKEEFKLMQTAANIIGNALERQHTQDKIKASLKEKEVLLQEIHHRVKNNMQIVVSLLRLQSYTAKNKKLEDMFKVAQNRIRSMAIIHEKLYQSKDFARIDFALYIQSLTTHLMQIYQIDPKQITLKTDVKDVHLDINQGVPVGLLINELVSNALKHAFPKGKKGEISLKFSVDKKGKKTLIVSDNGIGFPEKVNIRKPETLGLQMIKDLTKQIGGKLDLDTKAGTKFTITFS